MRRYRKAATTPGLTTEATELTEKIEPSHAILHYQLAIPIHDSATGNKRN